MSLELTPAQDAAVAWAVPGTAPPVAQPGTTREIPYDHVARFELKGRRGERIRDVINVSTDGAFIATSIGYSFIPQRLDPPPDPPVRPPPPPPAPPPPAVPALAGVEPPDGSAGEATATRAAPAAAPAVSRHPWVNETISALLDRIPKDELIANAVPLVDWLVDAVQPTSLLQRLLLRLHGIDFKYTVVDSGTGRELQNLPIHNLAGLGSADGKRPFRLLPRPMLFAPRSTIRIEVEEVSEGPLYRGGELFIVFHGYKALG